MTNARPNSAPIRSKFLSLLGLVVIFTTFTASPALAYLDPITGSIVIQGLIAGFVAALAGIRSFREKIINIFKGKNKK